MKLLNSSGIKTIHKNTMYKLCVVKESKYNSLFLKKNVIRSKLSVISLSRASKLFNLSKEDIRERMK